MGKTIDPESMLAAMAQASRQSLAAFGAFVLGHPPADHHKQWIQAASNPDIKRLLIIAPPSSAKTTWISLALVAWHIGNNPLSTNYIGSISDAQASDRSRAVAQMIESDPRYHLVFPNIRPDKDNWRAGDYTVLNTDYSVAEWRSQRLRYGQPKDVTLFSSGVQSRGVIGRRLTGMVVLDDPHDDENSRTQLQRDRVWDWFRLTLLTRLYGPEAVVRVIMTRWNSDDMAGRIIESGGWTVMHTPAVIEEPPESESFYSYWPDIWPMGKLEAIKKEIGSVLFRASYQGDPRGLSGEVFQIEHIRRGYPEGFSINKLRKVVVTVDLAISQNETSAYSAIMTAGADLAGRLIVLNVTRGKWTFREQIHRIEEICKRAHDKYHRLDDVIIEQNQFQMASVQEMLARTSWPVRGVHHDKDKVARARGVSALAEAGMLYLGHGAYVDDLIDEMLEFPRGKDKDQVDTLSMAHHATRSSREVKVVQGNWLYNR
jgi:predicted phage terminase large subunit-like protein